MDNFNQIVLDFKMVHEDSVEAFYKLHQDMKDGNGFAEADILLKTERGVYEWYHLSYEAMFNEVGKATTAIGISENINAQKIQDHFGI